MTEVDIPDYVKRAINSYMGQSGKEYDYSQYLYYKNNWQWHFTIKRLAEIERTYDEMIAAEKVHNEAKIAYEKAVHELHMVTKDNR